MTNKVLFIYFALKQTVWKARHKLTQPIRCVGWNLWEWRASSGQRQCLCLPMELVYSDTRENYIIVKIHFSTFMIKKNLPRTQHLSSITLQAVKFILWVFPMFVHTNKCWRNRVILSPSLLTSNELSAILLEIRVCGVAVVFFWFLGTGEGITGQRASPELHQQCSLGSSVYSFYFRFMGNLIL